MPPGLPALQALTQRLDGTSPVSCQEALILPFLNQLRSPSSENLPPLAELIGPPPGSLGQFYLQLIVVLIL